MTESPYKPLKINVIKKFARNQKYPAEEPCRARAPYRPAEKSPKNLPNIFTKMRIIE